MNYSTRLSRRKLLLLLTGSLLVATTLSTPSEAAKKKRSRNYDRDYPLIERRQRLRDLPDSSPTPSPAPPMPEPYRPTSPALILGIGGGVLGGIGLLGAWLIKMNQKSVTPTPSPAQPRVKPVTQAIPEVADWYVFRSGKAEGPYTAMQLWEVQKITARTKVRRGEADWQKAGEVSELAKYLTNK